jgi:hypothetical protein
MNRQAFAAVLGVAALGIVLVGCASEMASGKPDARPADRYRCFNPTFMRGFQTPDDHTLIIESDDNQAYQLSLAGPCFGLEESFAVGVRSRMGANEVCDPFDADIVFRDPTMGGRRECKVMTIRHLTGDEAAKYVTPPKSAVGSSSSSAHQ